MADAFDVVVVGAGLAGLTAAHEVAAAGATVVVVDARGRVGGRVMTVTPPAGDGGGWFDLGATWHWSDQPAIQALAAGLGVEVFPQAVDGRALHERDGGGAPAPVELPPPPAAFLRFAGGAEQLCRRLAGGLPAGSLVLGERVTAIEVDEGGVVAVSSETDDGTELIRAARRVVVSVPPRLAVQDLSFAPALPPELTAVMEATPTWMAEAMKVVAVYESPFWRDAGWSGSAFSEPGPLAEVHDASVPGGPGALWGFVALDADFRDIGPGERVPLVLDQLRRLFGAPAADPVNYFERDWSTDPYTAERVHRHTTPVPYGHPSFGEPLWDGRLWWAGAETEAVGGGHMEGAVRSGRRAARGVLGGPGPA